MPSNTAPAVSLPPNDGTLRFILIGLPNKTKRTCPACACRIRDRRPGPVKQTHGVCIDRVHDDGRRENWLLVLCKGCAVRHYAWPAKTLDAIYWPSQWTDDTNAR